MNRFKKFVPIILILLLVLSGCGSKSTAPESDDAYEASSVSEATIDDSVSSDEGLTSDPDSSAAQDTSDQGKEPEQEADSEIIHEYSIQPAEENPKAPDPSTSVDPKLVLDHSEDVDPKIMVNPPSPAKSTNDKVDYGRIIFAGDSRTVDIFDASRDEIWDEEHDGIRVFCRDGCQSDYMISAVNSVGYEYFDTLVSWMGCNNYGDFSSYGSFYEEVLANGKNLVLCTVGPTEDAALVGDFDRTYYTNAHQIAYNNALMIWASQHNTVKVIPLYDYINQEIANGNLYIDPSDGIHYQPQPTGMIWEKILKEIR